MKISDVISSYRKSHQPGHRKNHQLRWPRSRSRLLSRSPQSSHRRRGLRSSHQRELHTPQRPGRLEDTSLEK